LEFPGYTPSVFTRLLILFVLLTAAPARAQGDFIASALKIVNQFHAESKARLKDLEASKAVASFRKQSLKSKELTAKDIESLRWVEKPGSRRFKLVYNLVDSYTDLEIASVGRLAAKVSTDDRKSVERTARTLATLKKANLEELSESLPLETYKRAEPKPVPIIDRAPFEKGATDGDGIWDR
jgi:hypothetical protein